MTTKIKDNRLADFFKNAFELGYKKRGNAYTKDSGNYHIVIRQDGAVVALANQERIEDVPYDAIPNLVWQGYIEKHE